MKKLVLLVVTVFVSVVAMSQHTIVMRNGDKVEGVVMELKDDVLFVAVNRQITELPMVNVSSIFFKEHVAYDGKMLKEGEVKTIKSGKYTIEYVMKDRTIEVAPKISNGTENKGTIVVDVKINRQGTVMSSKAGGVGSNTTNEYLLTKAEFAAKGARFNKHPTGPIETEGTITITY